MPTPQRRVEQACAARGTDAVVRACLRLLEGAPLEEDLARVLAGPAAEAVLDGREGGPTGSWPRVWAARGLLHAWDEQAAPAVVRALTDDAWRVREMAARVVARHHVEAARDAVLGLRADPVPRVRAAAARAVAALD